MYQPDNREEFNLVLEAFRQIYNDRNSLDSISISDLTNASEIPVGKIYAMFDNKNNIAIQVIKKTLYELFITFDEEVSSEMPTGDKLKAFISLQLEFLGPIYNLIKDLLPSSLNPFSEISSFMNETRRKYLDFLSQLFLQNHPNPGSIFKNLLLPTITNSFLLFNLSVLKYWEHDKSEGKRETLNYIEKGIKNFMVMSVLV